MRPVSVAVFVLVFAASGCVGGGPGSFVDEGSTYVYSVSGPGFGIDESSNYSITPVEQDGDVLTFDVEASAFREDVEASMSVNRSSLDYVEVDEEVDSAFEFYSGFSRPFPFVFYDLGPEKVEELVREGGRIEHSEFILESDGEVQDLNGFRAVNVSMKRPGGDGFLVTDYLVSPERPFMIVDVSSPSGYEISLELVRE